MERFERETQRLMRSLGVNGSYLGFRYTVYGILRTIANPDLVVFICKGLYVDVASHFHTTIGSVERNIRTIKRAVWKYGDADLLARIFGKELNEEPSNAAFIDALAQYVMDICSDDGKVS